MKKIFSIFLLSLVVQSVWSQSGEGYDPENPGDPQVTPTRYQLTLEASPNSGGSLSPSGTLKLEAGKTQYCYTNPHLGYEFKKWMVGDSLVSTNSSFYFTMPEHDAVLTAYFEWNPEYNPQNPGDPASEGYSHRVYVYATPSVGGYFNSASFTLLEGNTTNIYAYPREGYRFESWMCNGEVVSTDNPLNIRMGTSDIAYTATFVYNPVSPNEPSPNMFNATTGEVIIDNFTPGSLNNAIYTAVGSSDNYSLVQSITVIGRMQSSDFGFARSYRNCSSIDLSRTTGYTEIPSWSFEGAEALKKLYLPMNVEKVGENAFKGCTALKHIYLYATTPPMLAEGTLDGLGKSVTLHVPSVSVALYAAAEGWSKLTIQSLDENEKSITVSLPGTAGEYKNMTLELQNVQSGQVYRCLVTDRTSYTFFGLMKNTYYNIYLKNSNKVVLGEINNVALEDGNLNVSFESIKTMQNVTLSILTPEGKNVTADVTITWLDELGSYLRQGNQVSELLTGTNIQYRVKLSKELAMEYVQPVDVAYQVKNGENAIVLTLSPIKQISISGYVKDAATKQGISSATVSISQTLNGKYSKTIIAKTDSRGYYTAIVYNAPTSLAISAYDYVNQTAEVAIDPSTENVTADDIAMVSIIGATINVSLTYTPSVAEGETAETQNWYDDYQNVAYSIYNLTTGQEITQVSYRYPQLVVLDGAKIGDRLRLTARSKKDAFMPVEVEAIVDSTNRVEITVPIIQYGGINASFESSKSHEVVGILYDGNGYFINAFNYDESAALYAQDLKDGKYTLITMGKDSYFNSIYSLEQLASVGLVEKVDYRRNDFIVTSGVTQVANAGVIPELDTSKYKYIGDGTSFTVNKTSIVAGNYLTFSSSVDFDGEHVSAINDVELIVDIPESASFVEKSLLIGSSVSEYTLENNRIIIPLKNYRRKDNVRFCVIPKKKGSYAPSAFVRFMVDNEEKIVAIGAAKYEVESLSIIVPKTVAKKVVTVRGASLPGSRVEVFDNDIMIAQLVTPPDGSWNVSCELANAYNLSTHPIYAKVTTNDAEVLSETQECYYDVNANGVKTVTMTHYNAYYKKNMDVVFDMENGTTSPGSYYFYTAADYSFIVDFINNDTSAVSNVSVYAFDYNGKATRITASYDSKTNKWVAKHRFSSNDAPVNVSVDYDTKKSVLEVDAQSITTQMLEIEKIVQLYTNEKAKINTLFDKEEITYEDLKAFENESGIMFYYPDESITEDFSETDNMSDEEFESYMESLFAQHIFSRDSILESVDIFEHNLLLRRTDNYSYANGSTFDIRSCEGLVEEDLVNRGYSAIPLTDGSTVYLLTEEGICSYVNFQQDVFLTITIISEKATKLLTSRKISSEDFWRNVDDFKDKYDNAVQTINSLFDDIIAQAKVPQELIDKEIAKIGKKIADVQRYQRMSTRHRAIKLKWQIEEFKLQKALGAARLASRIAGSIVGRLVKCLPVVDYLSTLRKCYQTSDKIIAAYNSIPNPCEEDEAMANACKISCGALEFSLGAVAIADVLGNFTADAEIVGGALASVATAGTSLTVSAWGLVQKVAVQIGKAILDASIDYALANVKKDIANLKCEKQKDPEPPKPTNKSTSIIVDPSGYVYEGVSSNRLQGVTATAYYMETTEDMYGVLHDEPHVWDAEEYAQENPLFTDENGMYQWDVPQGLWQVKFEKEGYETTYSEWLPVPPPQLEVNIGMVQSRQPEVKQAHAYKDGIEVEFDKYMLPALLNTENILVSQNGIYAEGEVKLLNEETAYQDENVKYASKVRFVPTTPFTASEVMLTVANRVKSYAGLQMQDTYQQTFDIEQELNAIIADSVIDVPYENSCKLKVKVTPGAASTGKTLHVKSSSLMIALVQTEVYTLDKEGEAEIEVSGELPGAASLLYTVEGYDLTAQTIVNVNMVSIASCAAPTASIASGSTVEKGTAITLTCETEGATIYYTTDGTCPCDETGSRKVYDGTPIIINESVTIKAMAVAKDMYDSDVAEFVYIVDNTSGIEELTQDGLIQLWHLPVRNVLNVTADGKTIKSVAVASLNGVQVAASNSSSAMVTLDMTAVEAGIYIVTIMTDDGACSRKILKIE